MAWAMSEVRLPRCQLRIVWPHDGRDCQFPDRGSTVAVIRAMLTVAWTIPTVACVAAPPEPVSARTVRLRLRSTATVGM